MLDRWIFVVCVVVTYHVDCGNISKNINKKVNKIFNCDNSISNLFSLFLEFWMVEKIIVSIVFDTFLKL